MSIRKIAKGFTLIELLVVIAIIGILGTLLLPQISDALGKATATSLSSRARAVTQLIINENIEREALSQASIWPENSKVKLDGKGGGTTANDYFGFLVAEVDARPSMFSGAGIGTAANAEDLTTEKDVNAWCIMWGGGQNDNFFSNENPPFMITRNFKPEGSGRTVDYGANKALSLEDFSDSKPFQKKRVVVVFRDSSSLVSLVKNITGSKNIDGTRAFFGNPTATNLQGLALARSLGDGAE